MKRLIRGSVEGGRRRRDGISKVAQQVPLDSLTHGLDEGCLSNLVGRVVCIEVGHAARLTPQNRAWRGTYCRLPHDTDSTRPLPMVSPYQTANDAFGVTRSSRRTVPERQRHRRVGRTRHEVTALADGMCPNLPTVEDEQHRPRAASRQRVLAIHARIQRKAHGRAWGVIHRPRVAMLLGDERLPSLPDAPSCAAGCGHLMPHRQTHGVFREQQRLQPGLFAHDPHGLPIARVDAIRIRSLLDEQTSDQT